MGVSSPRNRLLQTLPPEELEDLMPRFERVQVQKGDILWSVGDLLDSVYFPEAGLSSNVAVTSEGRRIEVGCFGDDHVDSRSADVLLTEPRRCEQQGGRPPPGQRPADGQAV